jgi:hypothetical protein
MAHFLLLRLPLEPANRTKSLTVKSLDRKISMKPYKSNVIPGLVTMDLSGLPVATPDEGQLVRLESRYRATFINYSVRRDDLVRATRLSNDVLARDDASSEAKTGDTYVVPVIKGGPTNFVILENLTTAVEMLKVPSDNYRVLKLTFD